MVDKNQAGQPEQNPQPQQPVQVIPPRSFEPIDSTDWISKSDENTGEAMEYKSSDD